MIVNNDTRHNFAIKKVVSVEPLKVETVKNRQFYTYLHHDNFHRANSTTSLGSNGDNDTDMSYTVLSIGKVCGINNNQAYCIQSTGKCVAVRDVKASDFIADIQIDLTNETDNTRGCGLAFRCSDKDNYWVAYRRNTFFAVSKYVENTETRLAYIYAPSGGQYVKRVSVHCFGDKIVIYIDGIPFKEIYDSFNQTATMCGLFWEANSLGRVNYIDVKVPKKKEKSPDSLDEGGLPFYWAAENYGATYSMQFVTDNTNDSKRSNRFEIRKADGYKRSEIKLPRFMTQMGEQIISFDMMLGDDYLVYDPSEIISQFHDSPENGDGTSDNAKLQPDVALYIVNGCYRVRQQWDEKKGATPSDLAHSITADLGSIAEDVGNWVRWTWHIKWSYAEFFEPITELYKNGILVYTSSKPNTVNATNASYFKVGPYSWNYADSPASCNSTSRTMWIDNIEIIS